MDTIIVQRGHYGRLLVARIKPNQDVVESLAQLCRENGFRNAVVRSVVGSLIDANLAIGRGMSERHLCIAGPGVEILSVYGEATLTEGDEADVRLNAVVADTSGQIFAGRFLPGGNLSFITIEMTVQEWVPEGNDTALVTAQAIECR